MSKSSVRPADKTGAQRQAKRRGLFLQMREALAMIETSACHEEAKHIARLGLEDVVVPKGDTPTSLGDDGSPTGLPVA